MQTKVPFITDKQLLDSYSISDLTQEVESVYKKYFNKKIIIPKRIFSKTEKGGDYLYGAATNLDSKRFIVLGSAYMPWNKDKKFPLVCGYYMYISYHTGELLAVIDGTSLVNLRTGAKSAVAAKYLAKKDSTVLGIIGLGTQARTQIEAISAQFKLKKVLVWTRNPDTKNEHLQYVKEKTGFDIEFTDKEKVVAKSDILVVATHSKEPLISYKNLHKGQLVISLAHALEVNTDIVAECKSYVDLWDTANYEYGPVKEALDKGLKKSEIAGDLSEVVGGKVKPREDNDEIIYFQSLGVMHENLAAVEYFYSKIIENRKKTIDKKRSGKSRR